MTTSPGTTSSPAASAWLLPVLLLCGAVTGFVIGGVFGHHWTAGDWPVFTGLLKLAGDVFMNLLKMLVVPLIVTSMMVGIASLGDRHRLGGTFGWTLLYYMSTTVLAVILGLVLVNLIDPGVGSGLSTAATARENLQPVTWYQALFDMVRNIFPPNLVKQAAEGRILGLLVFSLVFGGLLSTMGQRGRRVLDLIDTVNDALMTLVRWVVWLAPIGVAGLVADRIGQAGGGAAVVLELERLGWYTLTVVTGLAVHGMFVLPAIAFFVGRRNPLKHMIHFSEALLTALATGSSAATLPVTIRDAITRAKISVQSARFVLPLGATINMDGTALYEAVAAVFIAQMYDIHLSAVQMVVVALTATLAAVGAAAIPQAGLVTMVMVLTAVGVPVEGIGLLLSVDWLLDRFRTTVNVWGDTIGAAIIDRVLNRH